MNEQQPLSIDVDAIGEFIRDFVLQPDPVVNRQVLERRPELLKPPLNFLVASFFDGQADAARASNDLQTLLPLLRRQALFQRCQEVGVDNAFTELAAGVSWPAQSTT